MPGPSANPIVHRALELLEAHPHWPSLQVLDLAMEGHRGQHLDFECDEPGALFCDWLDPPSRFAQLLKSAFGNHLSDVDVDQDSPAWQAVIEEFGERYDLWR